MFNNIGKKIKILAHIIMWVGNIALVTLLVPRFGSVLEICIFIGLELIIWTLVFAMYGFGELIDKVSAIERNTYTGQVKSLAKKQQEYHRIDEIEKMRSRDLITEDEYVELISKENE